MNYIKLETLEYPRYEGDIRLEYPEITEEQTGETFPCPPTYAAVHDGEIPNYDEKTQMRTQGTPQLIDGQWMATWIVRDLTQEELAIIAEIESQREIKNINKAKGSAPNAI
jgi:hypothetical protein